jgi:hypothetical protein
MPQASLKGAVFRTRSLLAVFDEPEISGLAPGLYWVRASNVRAEVESDPTTAANVTVK